MSVPSLGGDEALRPALPLPHPLRMAYRLVAPPADRYQVPLPNTVLVGVVPAESELRKALNVANMMHKLGGIDLSANLAVPMVFQENFGGKLTPLPADIKRVDVTGSDQT